MQIGTCVYFNSIPDVERCFAALQKNGFSSCQLMGWVPELWTPENAEKIQEMLRRYGVTVSAFWCGWRGPKVWNSYDGQLTVGLVPPEYRQMRIEDLCHGADFAKLLGIQDVVTHMGFIPENPFDPNYRSFCIAVRTVAEHLKAQGQFLLFETGQETPVTMLRCFEDVGTDNLGVNLDTANLILYGRGNPVDALDVYGSYVRGVHIKDGLFPTNGHDLGQEVPIGKGKADFPRLLPKLHRLGYDGHLTIEREIEGEGNYMENAEVLTARNYLLELLRDIG